MAVNDRVGAHRDRMRERGFRLVQMWVPVFDPMSSPQKPAGSRRQSESLIASQMTKASSKPYR